MAIWEIAYCAVAVTWGAFRLTIAYRNHNKDSGRFESIGLSPTGVSVAMILSYLVTFIYESALWPLCMLVCLVGANYRAKQNKT